MNKLFAMFSICFVLSGCFDKNDKFISEWRNSGSNAETIAVERVDGGYRITAKLDDRNMSMFDLDVKAVSEGKSLILADNPHKKLLELDGEGTVTSYLRNKVKSFTKVN